uniref:Sphingomyelin phosphodiesterase acid like 3B n=1 Tax=Rhinopithecus bieti TaxID=61621 RepID=A0A2K6M910_RHIBE
MRLLTCKPEGASKDSKAGGARVGRPWALCLLSLVGIKEEVGQDTFLLAQGCTVDDMSHVPNEKLGEAAVLEIVKCLTKLIREVFLGKTVPSVPPHHDFHPKNQFPAGINKIDNQIAELWKPWLSNESIALFKKGAFYSEKLPGPSGAGQIVVNELTADMVDPGQQCQWLEDVLTNASKAGDMVYTVGHLPPGFFEKTQNKAWFQEGFNEKYLKVVWKHGCVTAGQFFRHHHTDSFRMLYDDAGAPISAMFITPGVTPWKTTLPRVINGPNNPVIRVLKARSPVEARGGGCQANAQGMRCWELEYQLTKAYWAVLDCITGDQGALQHYYVYNSVSYYPGVCDEAARVCHAPGGR